MADLLERMAHQADVVECATEALGYLGEIKTLVSYCPLSDEGVRVLTKRAEWVEDCLFDIMDKEII